MIVESGWFHEIRTRDEFTSLDYIDTNILSAGVDTFLHKFWWCFVDAADALCVLRSQSSCCSHSITAVGSNDLLVGLEASADQTGISRRQHIFENLYPYAPPELSDPATTRIRLALAMFVVCLIIIVEKMRWLNVELAAAVIGMFSPSRFRAALLFSLLQHKLLEIIIDGSYMLNRLIRIRLFEFRNIRICLMVSLFLSSFIKDHDQLTSDKLILEAALYLGG